MKAKLGVIERKKDQVLHRLRKTERERERERERKRECQRG
jgi:hypothetical protein